MNEETKTVQGTFQEMKMTRAEFIKRWMTTYTEFYKLADTVADYTELKRIEKRLMAMAGRAWDSIK